MDTFKVKNSWFEAIAMAMYEKWVSILDYAFMLLFISSFIPYFWGKDGEILMWGALFVALIDCVRIYSVARAIRQGRRARIEKTEFRHRKIVGAWMSVG